MNNNIIYYQSLINNLSEAIKTNRFKSKDELNNYLQGLKQNGIPESYLSNEKVLELLNQYDEYHPTVGSKLDIQNYKGITLENQNIIASTKDDTILKTENSPDDLNKEFKEVQNEITANSQNGLANADKVYENLKDKKKEEVTLLSYSEVLTRDDIDSELLSKIKFFINNKYINPYEYKISINDGIFYNIETDEAFEVRKNEQTGKYEIYKGGESIYKEETTQIESSTNSNADNEEDNEKIEDSEAEKQVYENRLNNVKVRRLIKPSDTNSMAFIKSSFIIMASIVLTIIMLITLFTIHK